MGCTSLAWAAPPATLAAQSNADIIRDHADRQSFDDADYHSRAILPLSATEFYRHDMSLDHVVFTLGTDNTMTTLEWRGRSGTPTRAERIDTPLAH